MPGRSKKRNPISNLKGKKCSSQPVETVSLAAIPPWSVDCTTVIQEIELMNVDNVINSKVSLHQGDITKLEVDVIVNAANESLLGGGGVDKAIHKAAGADLKEFCKGIPEKYPDVRCMTGECIVTDGFELPSKFIFHAVAPRDNDCRKLQRCYESCLSNIAANQIKSIAFCCLGTGIFNFDQTKAAEIALATIRSWLEDKSYDIDRIILCTFTDEDFQIYKELMASKYFPVHVKLAVESTEKKSEPVTVEDTDIDFNINPLLLLNARLHDTPLGLQNENVNVCFFNSVIQVLYSLPDFQNYVGNMPILNQCFGQLKELFREINTQHSSEPIKTSKYVTNIGLRNYRFRSQHDAHECLINIIENCYPDQTVRCMFQYHTQQTLICENRPGYHGCGNIINKLSVHKDLQLHPLPTQQLQSIQQLLNKLNQSHGVLQPDNRCELENCDVT